MVNQNERLMVWESMLDIDLAQRYYGKLAYRLEARDKRYGYATFMLTILSAASVGLELRSELQLLATLITAGLTGVTVFYRFGRAAEQASQLYRMNAEALVQYERLWNRIDEQDHAVVQETHDVIQRGMIAAGQAAVREFTEDKGLATEAQQEVLKSRGLKRE
jgi:hypothetical protein